jgi:membrane-associated phospholipid phosphatase
LSLSELLFGTQLIEMLQSMLAPEFDVVFTAITLLGDGAVLVGLSATIYWGFDKSRGRLVTYVLLFGAYLNFFLKIVVPSPRPPTYLRLTQESETSYGFPSGHAQDSTTFWSWTAMDFRKKILGLLGAVIVVSVGVSRIYLGLHYPVQVLGGWIIGLTVSFSAILVLRHYALRPVKLIHQILFAFSTLIPMMVAVGFGLVGDAYPAQIGGHLFGFALGVPVEENLVRFANNVRITKKILRLGMGGALTWLLSLTMEWVLPGNNFVPSFFNSFVRGFFIAAVVPALFTWIEHRYA